MWTNSHSRMSDLLRGFHLLLPGCGVQQGVENDARGAPSDPTLWNGARRGA